MKPNQIFSLVAALFIGATPQAIAQNKNNAALTRQFRQNFVRGCNQGKTPGVENQKGYCACLANSYQARYTGTQLSAISQLASQAGDGGSTLVNIMMAPEAKTCSAKY